MVRLSDVVEAERKHLEQLPCQAFDSAPFAPAPPLPAARVALVSSAGLIRRGERPVPAGDSRYRAIAHDAPAADVLMSHVSSNFDRTGFQQDLNVVLPRDRLDELVAAGQVGAAAPVHYSFMGATAPQQMERHARRLAGELREQGVDAALLLPV